MHEWRPAPSPVCCGNQRYGFALALGFSSCRLLIAFLSSSPLNAERITARGGGMNLDVIHFGMGEQPLDGWFHSAVGDIFLGKQAAAADVGFQRAGTAAEFVGKTGI